MAVPGQHSHGLRLGPVLGILSAFVRCWLWVRMIPPGISIEPAAAGSLLASSTLVGPWLSSEEIPAAAPRTRSNGRRAARLRVGTLHDRWVLATWVPAKSGKSLVWDFAGAANSGQQLQPRYISPAEKEVWVRAGRKAASGYWTPPATAAESAWIP